MIHIVKIGDKYAIRKQILFFTPKYLDLVYFKRWRTKGQSYFSDCLGTLELVKEKLIYLGWGKDKDEIIEIIK